MNGDLLAKSGLGMAGGSGESFVGSRWSKRGTKGKGMERAREAGKKKKKWILEKFFRNAIAFVMMFRLVRRLHLACTFREGGDC